MLVTLTSSFIIGILGWTNGRDALRQSITNQLTSIRASQAYQIETYFDRIFSQTRTLAEDRMIVNAMKQFKTGYGVGLHRSLDEQQNAEVSQFYSKAFSDKLAEAAEDTPMPIMFEPKRSVVSYFQYHYVVKNPYPLGEKDQLTQSKDELTIYSRFHRFYHPIMRNLANEFGYYDIFLIDVKSLSIVYSVFKETDFGTSLLDGPYQDSGLGVLAKQIIEEPTRGEVTVTDFRPYTPSYGAPAAFVGSPIYDGNELIGMLAMQLPAAQINDAMTYGGAWEENGLGQTGESYLVGSDKMMRSDARLLLEEEETFFDKVGEGNFRPNTVKNITVFNTTNAFLPVVSDSVLEAFDRNSGTHLTRNYLGEPVLSSFAPLNIPGLDWAIISEMATSEAFNPIAVLQRNILIWGVVLVLITALLSMLISRYFVSPIEKLSDGVRRLSSGQDDVSINIDTRDEFGQLATSFNTMVSSIREKSATIARKTEENEALLLNILPGPIAERFQAGEVVADQLQQVTIAHLQIKGLDDMSANLGVTSSAALLHALVDRLDDLGESYEVEPVKTLGNTYIVACGLTRTRLDHSRQTVDFALAALKMLTKFNAENSTQLSLKIGVAAGPVTSAVVGTRQFHYELWGRPADLAARIRFEAKPNSILVTDEVQQKVQDHFNFSKPIRLEYDDMSLDLHSVILKASHTADE